MNAVIQREANWEIKLFREVDKSSTRPFVWHDNDCASFACRCVQEMTGADLFAEYRGTYDAKIDAFRTILRGDGLRGLATSKLGPELSTPLKAQRGDVVLVYNNGFPALAICTGRYACSPGETGLTYVPSSQWIVAWSVG